SYPHHEGAGTPYPQYGQSTSSSFNPPKSTPSSAPQSHEDATHPPSSVNALSSTPQQQSSGSSDPVRPENRYVQYEPSRRPYPVEQSSSTSAPQTTNPNASSQQSSSYNPPTTTRSTPVSLPSLAPLSVTDRNDRNYSSGSNVQNHPYLPTNSSSSSHSSSQHSKSPQITSQKHSPYEQHPQPPYPQPSSNSSVSRMTFPPVNEHPNGGKKNGVSPNMNVSNEHSSNPPSSPSSGYEGSYPSRRQGGDAEGERNVSQNSGGEKY
ncbi:7994_t:CDS:1, partial [Acaulospora morrowiae]